MKIQPAEFRVLRLRECEAANDRNKCDSAEAAARYWEANIPQSTWYDPDKEAFVVICLSTRRHALGHNLVTLGLLDNCFVHPREVFRPAIVAAAHSVILMHNHPSGDPTPSEADIKVTRDLIRAGQLLKIDVVDHVIMGKATPDRPKAWVSMKEMGYFF